MTQSNDHGALCVTSDPSSGGADEVPAEVTDAPGPAAVVDDGHAQPVRTDEQARPPLTSVDLATVARVAAQLAEITQSLDALTASAAAIRADVESTGEALAQLTAGVPLTPEAEEAPVDLVAQAAQLATIWIERSRHHPLRAALVMLEGWSIQLRDAVSRGRLLSSTSIDEALAVDRCPSGRWLHSGRADELDRVRAAEARHLHSEHHRLAALVLTEVRDGRIDEARHLLESEDGYAGLARRLDEVVRSWIDALSEQP